MSRFRTALRRAAGELDVPGPIRAAILLEMAADLEAAYEHGRRQGLGELEAGRRAEERVVGSPIMTRRLGRLHADAWAGSWRGWSERTGGRLSRGMDLLLVGVAVVPTLGVAAAVSIPLVLRSPTSILLWLVIAAGAGIAGLVGVDAGRLLRGRVASIRRPPLLLLLSLVAPALGILAFAAGLRSTALLLATGDPELSASLAVAGWMATDGALLALGILLGISGVLSSFVLLNRASVLVIREADALLDDGPPSDFAERSSDLPLVRRRRR